MPGEGVLPSWLLGPTLLAALWAGAAFFVFVDASSAECTWAAGLPAAVVLACTLADYRLWLKRRRPWHDWAVIGLLLPAIAASAWITVGGLVLDLGLSRAELLGVEVGPGLALVGLLSTTISFHGRHHPEERGLP